MRCIIAHNVHFIRIRSGRRTQPPRFRLNGVSVAAKCAQQQYCKVFLYTRFFLSIHSGMTSSKLAWFSRARWGVLFIVVVVISWLNGATECCVLKFITHCTHMCIWHSATQYWRGHSIIFINIVVARCTVIFLLFFQFLRRQ